MSHPEEVKGNEEITPGTLKLSEPHPASYDAYRWLRAQGLSELYMWLESFSSCAIEGNRHAEVCAETLQRFLEGRPISDRYLLGLCWSMKVKPVSVRTAYKKRIKKMKKGATEVLKHFGEA